MSNVTRLSLSSALRHLSGGESTVQHFLGMGHLGHNGKRGGSIRIESGWSRAPQLRGEQPTLTTRVNTAAGDG